MTTRRVSFLIMLLVALVGQARAENLGTYKGPVKVKSSFSMPGVMGKDRVSQMTLKLTRNGPDLHVETHDPDALGPGKGLTVTGIGRIVSSRNVNQAHVLEIEFAGAGYTQSIGQQLNHALSLVPAASGMSISVTQATGRTLLELAGNDLKLQSTSTVDRGKIGGGFKARLADMTVPRQITNTFEGLLQRQP
jgi:hypothetical protein